MKRIAAVMFIALLAVFVWGEAAARAGGGVSVGRSAPSFSRAPSYSAPAAPRYSAPRAPAPRAPAPSTTTVIQQGGGGGGFGSSFLGGAAGAMVGNALSHSGGGVVAAPAAAPVAVSGVATAAGPGGTVIVQDASHWGWFWFLLLACMVGGLLVWLFMRNKDKRATMNEDEFDPLHFFYAVQQAAMRDDLPALNRLCTRGMATALSGSPEPDRIAAKTLTGVTHRWIDEDSIEYRFTDTKEDKRVTELWQLSRGRLEGIEVVA